MQYNNQRNFKIKTSILYYISLVSVKLKELLVLYIHKK